MARIIALELLATLKHELGSPACQWDDTVGRRRGVSGTGMPLWHELCVMQACSVDRHASVGRALWRELCGRASVGSRGSVERASVGRS